MKSAQSGLTQRESEDGTEREGNLKWFFSPSHVRKRRAEKVRCRDEGRAAEEEEEEEEARKEACQYFSTTTPTPRRPSLSPRFYPRF